MNNVMVDLETLGNGPQSVIIAIGAVKFDESGLGEEFYEVVDAQSCVDAGLKMDVSTIMWWMQQSDEARAAFKRESISLWEALDKFSDFVGADDKVWGNGASFDNTILGSAYRAVEEEQPWKFWNDRCYRTVKAMYPDKPIPRSGVHHNALDDAKSQALHLISFGVKL